MATVPSTGQEGEGPVMLSVQARAFLPSSSDYRLVEVGDKELFSALSTPSSSGARKRSRADDKCTAGTGDSESKDESLPVNVPILKASEGGAAVTTGDGKTFVLRRVAYSNTLLLVDGKEKEGHWVGVEQLPALYECVQQTPKFDGLLAYLVSVPLGLDEIERTVPTPHATLAAHRLAVAKQHTAEDGQDLDYGQQPPQHTLQGTIPSGVLHSWGDLVSVVCASEHELRQFLADRHVVVFDGFVRLLDPALLNQCVLATVAQIEGLPIQEGCTAPWESIELKELRERVAFPPLVVSAALSVLGCKHASKKEGTVSFVAEKLVAAVGVITLRQSGGPNASMARHDFLQEWTVSVPLGLQGVVDLPLLQGWCLRSAAASEDQVRYCDMDRLSTDPRQRLHTLFSYQGRILASELRYLLGQLYHPVSGGGSHPDLDNLLGRSCREHKGKKGQFYSLE